MNTDAATSFIPFIPLDQRSRKEWIKYALHCRGITLDALAREHGVTRQTPQAALRVPIPKWERIIADALGIEPHTLWPERYGPDGQPNRKVGRPLGYSPKNNKAQQPATQYPEAANR